MRLLLQSLPVSVNGDNNPYLLLVEHCENIRWQAFWKCSYVVFVVVRLVVVLNCAGRAVLYPDTMVWVPIAGFGADERHTHKLLTEKMTIALDKNEEITDICG